MGTPSLPIALAVRASKMASSLSQFWPARAVTVSAIALILPVTSLILSSASPCVFFCRLSPSLTRASNTFEPSSWAFAKAPMPASQICCAESLTDAARWLTSFLLAAAAVLLLSFLTMLVPRLVSSWLWKQTCPDLPLKRNIGFTRGQRSLIL